MNILFKLLCGPLISAIGGLLKIGGAYVAGRQHQKGIQAAKDLERISKNMEHKNEIEHNVNTSSDDDILNRLYTNWSKPTK